MSQENILLITTDQQRFDCLQHHGNGHIWTPHLNWLCDNGIRFDNAYSDCPVCLPARTTIMSGKHAWHHQVMSNRWVDSAYDASTSLPGRLNQAGYHTWLVGKSHHGPNRRHLMGFQQQQECEVYHRFYNRFPELGRPRRSGHPRNQQVPGIDTVGEEHTLSHWTVETALQQIELRDPSQPFFGWVSFFDPHPPFIPAASWFQIYQNQAMPPPQYGDWSASFDDIAPAYRGVTWELSQIQRHSAAQLEQAKRSYYALISQIDSHLGLLFGRLKELKLLQNTWIIFTADHGEMLGDHHLGGKCVPFEGASHVPMIVKPPLAPRDTKHPLRGTTSPELVCLADILPTCCNIAGVDAGADHDGIDLVAAAQGQARREELYGSCMYMHYLRRGSYKYCRETLSGNDLCFDLSQDPYEQHDLVRAGTAPAELTTAMDHHVSRVATTTSADPGVAQSDIDMPQNVHPGQWHPRGYGL